jgi:hypothetical protein
MSAMSMYRDLLAVAVQAGDWGEDGRPSSDVLLAHLADCRERLAAQGPGAGPLPGVVGDLALQLEYDLTLMQLCIVVGVDHDIERFDQPVFERQRLERALHDQGVDLPNTCGEPR